MRAIFLILIVAVVVLIAAFATGYLDISQTRQAKAPAIEAASGAICAQGAKRRHSRSRRDRSRLGRAKPMSRCRRSR